MQPDRMKTYRIIPVILLIACSVVLRNCSDDENQARTIPNQDGFKTIRFVHSMKGWELYSWPKGSHWRYSILPGTDLVKTLEEVTSNGLRVNGKDSLKMLLSKFPVNEEITWIGEAWLDSAWSNDYGNLSLPPIDTLDEIKQYCELKDLNLQVTDK
jgi:hypothetical protein